MPFATNVGGAGGEGEGGGCKGGYDTRMLLAFRYSIDTTTHIIHSFRDGCTGRRGGEEAVKAGYSCVACFSRSFHH